MANKKYLVIPGPVCSKRDGDRHYIEADKLMRLYGVNPADCIIHRHDRPGERHDPSLIWLIPQYSGDYTLPTS